jgi:hypothetical protein
MLNSSPIDTYKEKCINELYAFYQVNRQFEGIGNATAGMEEAWAETLQKARQIFEAAALDLVLSEFNQLKESYESAGVTTREQALTLLFDLVDTRITELENRRKEITQ